MKISRNEIVQCSISDLDGAMISSPPKRAREFNFYRIVLINGAEEIDDNNSYIGYYKVKIKGCLGENIISIL